MKILTFKKDARLKLAEGAKMMYDAVCITLSPKGRNVAITRQWGSPIVLHDGVSVAREVESADEFVNTGIQLIREAAQKTNDGAGDGTTTSTLLAYHLIDKGMVMLDNGENPMVLREQMEAALPELNKKLKSISKDVKDNADIKRVATISSGDEEIGSFVAQAVDKVGRQGLITVEEGGMKMGIDFTEGMEFDRGFAAPHFVTNPARMEAIIENPIVAVLGKKVTLVKEILPLLEVMSAISKNMLVIGDVEGDALKTCIVNKMKGNINIVVVTPPGYGDRKTNTLEDIALVTGATVVSDELGLDLAQFQNQFDKKWLGKAKSTVVGRLSTVIIKLEEEDAVIPAEKNVIIERDAKIAGRIQTLEAQIENETSIFEKEKAQERLAKLTQGVAVIQVGAATEAQMRERIERTKDAVSAARAAAEEGIVPGGGVAFVQLASVLKDSKTAGGKLLYETLQEPTIKLLQNAGESDENSKKIQSEIKTRGGDFGYNVTTGNVEDLVKAGVIDPAKVIRLSLENAIAVAGTILSTDCIIADKFVETPSNMQVV